MTRKHSFFLKNITGFFFILFLISSCKKVPELTNPPEEAHFTNSTGGSYFITSPGVSYKIPVGITNTSSANRIVSFTVNSPTGAVAGTHYSLPGGNTVTIPPGKAIDSITVSGVFSQYTSGRKDTLVFTITEPSVKASSYNKEYKLFMRGPCFEGDADLTAFQGTYPRTNELFGTSAYGPYTVTISAITPLTATTGKITVTNIWNSGWGPIDFILDWTNPANRTVTVVPATSGIADAGTLSSTYAGSQVAVRNFSGQPGTFSFCSKTIVLKMQLGVAGLGYFGSLYTVTPGK